MILLMVKLMHLSSHLLLKYNSVIHVESVAGGDVNNQGPIVSAELTTQTVEEGQTAQFECQFAVQSNLEVICADFT